MSNTLKLSVLCDEVGLDEEELIRLSLFDSVSPGICSNPDCDYTTEVEPDQQQGWCECCDTNTVVSGLVLAGVV